MTDKATITPDALRMFGCDIDAFCVSVDESITAKVAGVGMAVLSQLSDAQEQMAGGDVEGARQTINRAKYLIDRHRLGLNG